MPINAKKKGNRGENEFALWLQSHGFKAYKNGSSGGNINKSDIHNNLDANLEVKTVKRINLQEAWAQSNRDASLARSTPYVCIHFDGMPKNEWLVVMHSEDWVNMLKKSRGMADKDETPDLLVQQDSREKRYALENLKSAITKAIKHL